MTLKNRAAAALDQTHFTNKGIDTPAVRDWLAGWLDGSMRMSAKSARVYVKYLEMVAARA